MNTANQMHEFVPASEAQMSLLETASGALLDLLNPQTHEIRLEDIAATMVRLPRYNGHATGQTENYSQGMHAMWVALYLYKATGNPVIALQGLLRNAYKAYTGELPRPMVNAAMIQPQLQMIEERVQAAIYQALDIPALTVESARWLDQAKAQATAVEAAAMMPSCGEDWDLPALDYVTDQIGFLEPIEPWIAELAFMGYVEKLRSGECL